VTGNYFTTSPGVRQQLAQRFQSQQPYPYLDMSGLFEQQALKACAAEIDRYVEAIPLEKEFYGSHRKHKLSELEKMPPACKAMVAYLNGPEFIAQLEEITGIPGLQPDPFLLGGGIHAMHRGKRRLRTVRVPSF
jgi:hypothetical protein